jgi:hypothetical protein
VLAFIEKNKGSNVSEKAIKIRNKLAFQKAKAANTIDALEQFIAAHPDAVEIEEAKVALVAEEAAPLRVAVIVPALKLPEPSRATTLLAVLVVVASTANVRAVDPLKVPPLVRYVPAVKAAAVAFAVVAVVASVAEPAAILD